MPALSQTAVSENTPWRYVNPKDSIPGYCVYTRPVEKSPQDDRSYRVIRLENGLQAVLVHDSRADKAAASLDVAVGHLNDPDDMPGLAHFCEHLLFMGTEQFPKENEYSEYLAKNGGHSNAFTAAHNTNYHFNVSVHAFAGALERFSGFFHSPLFEPSCTTREINAVDSENKKNLHQDMWRIFQLNKHLTKPGHPWSKFGSGNKLSLTRVGRELQSAAASSRLNEPLLNGHSDSNGADKISRETSPTPSNHSDTDTDGGVVGRETRRRLVEWWSKEYCAGRMGLALVGRESLEKLAELAATFFSPIRNRQQDPLPIIPDHPFGIDEIGTFIHVKTIMDFYAVELSFPLEDQSAYWTVKPGSFISHFVGHEGPGSLHSYLKGKGWITSLSSGPQNLGRGFAMFKITIHLTKDGFLKYRDVILACHKYLALLRSSPLPSWNQEEIKRIHEIRFNFAEKYRPDSYATRLSATLHQPYPRERILSGPALIWDWDENLVRKELNSLTVDNGRAVIMAQDHSVIGQLDGWQKEPWYGTEFIVYKMDPEFVASVHKPDDVPGLYLPPKNEFIPSNVDVEVHDVPQPSKRPSLIKKTEITSVWHKKDDQFWVPKAHLMLDFRSPIAKESARSSVMMRLYGDLIVDSLTEIVYDADLAGLRYDLDTDDNGISLAVSGYNDKLHVLASRIVDRMKHLEITADRLKVVKEQVTLVWQNFFLDQSYRLSDYYGKYLLDKGRFTLEEKLAEIQTITVVELEEFVQKYLTHLRINVLVSGNLRKQEALDMSSMIEEILATQPVSDDSLPHHLSLILPEGCNYVWEKTVPNPNETNSGLTYYCHIGNVVDPRLRVVFGMLSNLIAEPAFNILRTKEQLGYIVSSSSWLGTGSMGLRVVVQSEKDPRYLETRVDAFLAGITELIETMSESEFEEQKKGLIHKWSEKLKNLAEETNRFWRHIDSGYLDFQRREHDAAMLATVTREEVLALHQRCLEPSSSKRSKLSVHLRPQKVPPRKFSVLASQAYHTLLVNNNIAFDKEAYATACASEPPVEAFKAHWSKILLSSSDNKVDPLVGKMLVDAIDELAVNYPVLGEGEVQLREDTIIIKDVAEFKSKLKVSEPPTPLDPQDYHSDDLRMSKF